MLLNLASRSPTVSTRVQLIAFVALCAAVPPALSAQIAPSTTYVGVEAGAVFDASQLNVRSGIGLTAGAVAGRQLSGQVGAELRLGLEYFGRPTEFVHPCLPTGPCNYTLSEQVAIVTFGADAVLGSHRNIASPLLLIGAGLRRINSQPGRVTPVLGGPSRLAPFGEVGTGVEVPIGVTRLSIETRYQIAVSDPGLPAWTLPVTLAIRF
jgi:hypothetical protein